MSENDPSMPPCPHDGARYGGCGGPPCNAGDLLAKYGILACDMYTSCAHCPKEHRQPPPTKEPRSVYYGILAPGERETIALDTALTESEQPVLVTPGRGLAVITSCSIGSTQIEILSKHVHGVPYALVIAPRAAIKAATLPWQSTIATILGAVGDLAARMKAK